MPKLRLTHICNVDGCQGVPGQIIDVSGKDAAWLIERSGAVEVKDATPQPAEAGDGDAAATGDGDETETDHKRRSRRKRKT